MDARSEMLCNAAKRAAYDVGPRLYELTDLPDGPFSFILVGCQGDGHEHQHEVASFMNETLEARETANEPKPVALFGAGDNFYEDGVKAPNDPKFKTHIHDLYYADHLTHLNQLPFLLALGNHDGNRQIGTTPLLHDQGEVLEINQCAHTYFAANSEGIEAKKAMFMQEKISVHDLMHFNMPFLFYAIKAKHTIFAFLNSNTFLQDVLNLHTDMTAEGYDRKTGRINQAYWAQLIYQKSVEMGADFYVVWHHPALMTGKRSERFPEKFDSTHYMYDHDLARTNLLFTSLDKTFKPTNSYNSLLVQALKTLKIAPFLIIAAHEHSLVVYNNSEDAERRQTIRQFTTGTGGADKLDDRRSYRDHPYVGAHANKYGFGIINCDPAHPHTYVLDVYAKKALHLKFNQASHLPLIMPGTDHEVLEIREKVLSLCNSFFYTLKQAELNEGNKESAHVASSLKSHYGLGSWIMKTAKNALDAGLSALSHYWYDDKLTRMECQVVQNMFNYINQYHLPDAATLRIELAKLTELLPFRDHKTNIPAHRMLLNDNLASVLYDKNNLMYRLV